MRRKEYGKRIAAWIISAAMVFGNSSFAVLAEEAPEEAAVMQEEASEAVLSDVDAAEEEESLLEILEEENSEEELADEEISDAAEEGMQDADETLSEDAEDEQIIGDSLEMELAENALVAPVADEGEEEGWSIAINSPYSNPEGSMTWVYLNKTIYLGVNVETPDDAQDTRIEWSCVDYDDVSGEEKEGESKYISASEEEGAYAITGKALTQEDECVKVKAKLYAGEEEVASAEIVVFVMEPHYWYNEPLSGPGENELLPGWTRNVSMDCMADDFDPENEIWPGNNLPVAITNVEVTASGWWEDDEDGGHVKDDGQERLEVWDNEDGSWTIRANGENSYGCAELTYTYTDLLTGKDITGTCVVFINGDHYDLGWDYSGNTEDMLTNSQKDIEISLYHNWNYGENWGDETLEDYTVEIMKDENGNDFYDTDLVKVEITEDGKGLLVTSNTETGETYIPVRASFEVEGEPQQIENYWIRVNVAEGYHNILPASLDVNPALGEELDLSQMGLKVWQYTADTADATDITEDADIRIRLEDYDGDAWSVEEGAEEELLPVLTRTGEWDTSITLVAEGDDGEGNWQELTRREFSFGGLDYSVWFNEEGILWPEEFRTLVFTNDTLDLSLNTENLDDKGDAVSIEWSVHKGWDEENDTYGEEITTGFTGDGAQVALDVGALADAVRNENGDIESDVAVVARVMYGDRELSSTDVWVAIADPQCSLEWSKPQNMLQGDDIQVEAEGMSCYLRDKEHLDGESVDAVITDISLVQAYQWDDKKQDDVPVDEQIVGIEKQENGWLLKGDDFGWAELKVTYTLDGGETTNEEIIEIHVSADNWYLDWAFQKGTGQILAGKTAVIENVILRHDYIDFENENEHIYGEETDYTTLSVQWDDVDDDGNPYPTYDPDMVAVEVTEDGKGLRITANNEERYGGTDIYIRAMIPVTDEEGNEIKDEEGNAILQEMAGDNVYVDITDTCEHSWQEEKRVDATCTQEGSVTFICELCGEEKEETLDKIAHKPGEWIVTKAATCTEAGTKVQKCTVCNTVIGTQAVSALGHSYGAWTQETSATVFAAATETRKCSRCGNVEKRSTGTKLAAYAKLTAKSVKMQVKQKTSAFKVTEMAAGDYVKSWKSSNTKVLKVSGKSNGTCKLTAQKKTGKATLTITFASGLKKTVKVTVQKNKVTTTKITGVPKKLTLKVKKSTSLKPVLTPFDSQQKVTYKTSNKKVATVSSKGKITAKKKGKAVITVTSGKKKVKCTVTVK